MLFVVKCKTTNLSSPSGFKRFFSNYEKSFSSFLFLLLFFYLCTRTDAPQENHVLLYFQRRDSPSFIMVRNVLYSSCEILPSAVIGILDQYWSFDMLRLPPNASVHLFQEKQWKADTAATAQLEEPDILWLVETKMKLKPINANNVLLTLPCQLQHKETCWNQIKCLYCSCQLLKSYMISKQDCCLSSNPRGR